jgi:putative hemolysin
VAQATASGTVRAEEEEIVGRVLHLGDRPVAAVMTPRTDLSWGPLTAADDEVRRILLKESPSWLLLCGDTVDDVVGVAGARDLLAGMVSGQPHDLGAAARIPLFVPEALTMLQLMEALRSSETPVAIVLDEFGGVQGMVTFTDLVRHLVGDLSTGPDDGPDVLRRPDGTWLIDASAPLEEVEEALGLARPGGDARRDYHTVGGFVLSQLGHVPRPGEQVEYQGIRFEAVQLDGPRIVRILASALRPRRTDGGTSPPGTKRASAEEIAAEKR